MLFSWFNKKKWENLTEAESVTRSFNILVFLMKSYLKLSFNYTGKSMN